MKRFGHVLALLAVVVCAFFGGYLLGHRGTGTSDTMLQKVSENADVSQVAKENSKKQNSDYTDSSKKPADSTENANESETEDLFEADTSTVENAQETQPTESQETESQATASQETESRATESQKTESQTTESQVTESQKKPEAGSADSAVDDKKTEDKEMSKSSNSFLATPASCGALQVCGTQLCDKDGNPVQLRGISTHGLAWFPSYVNADLFGQFRQEWNVNVMRLAMYTAEYGGYCTADDTMELKKLVRNGVKYATENDMYVIIDWHILSDGNPNTYKEEAINFFREMSKVYAESDNVIYEICNEPNGGTSWSEIKKYAEEVIPVIRKNDADAVIIVGTPNWSQFVDQAAADPITGYDNIMYALHFYAATHKEDLRSKMTSAIENGLPIFVTEYGICDASGNGGIDETQANKWVDTMDRYGVSYVNWNLSNKNETSSIIKTGSKKTKDLTEADLSSSGKWLYQMLTGKTADSVGNSFSENAGNKDGGSSQSNAESQNRTESQNSVESQNSADSNHSGSGEHNQKNDQYASDTVSLELCNSWTGEDGAYYQYSLHVTNATDETSQEWDLTIKFNQDIILSQGWSGDYSGDKKSLTIHSAEYNGSLEPGQSIGDIGFILISDDNLKVEACKLVLKQ